MSGTESLPYKPEDVIETEGEDKGRIKDVELARVGAERENEIRDALKHPGVTHLEHEGETKWAGSIPKEKHQEVADQYGTGAMESEVFNRARDDAELVNPGENSNLTDEEIKKLNAERKSIAGRKAADEFVSEQKRLSEERMNEII